MKRRKVALTSEWLTQWSPRRTEEVADAGCKGLVVRAGPTGVKTFYRWQDVRDEAGRVKRKRVKLGHFGTLTLADARDAVHAAREVKRSEAPGAPITVTQIADSYRRDVLTPNRETAEAVWNTIRLHILEAKPDPKLRPFGEWPAREVKPLDLAALVRNAKQQRTVDMRRMGGPGVGRVVLRELKSIFAHAVETGALAMTPAGTLRARAFGLGATARARWLDADELQALFAALDLNALLDGTAKRVRLTPTVRLAVAFQLYVPLRSHSLIAARWSEVDLEARTWTVPVEHLKLRKQDRAVARPFVVPLPETAVAIIQRLRARAGKSPWILASPQDGTNHIEGKALIHAIVRLQKSDRLALGAPFTIHDLRRTWRTWAQNLGVDDAVAERSLGHAALDGVAGVYGRSQLVEQRAKAAELVGAAFDRLRLGQAATVVPIAEGQ